MTQRYALHITATGSGISAIDLLAANAALSKQRLKTAMSHGAVWLESGHGIKRIRRAKKPLK